MNELVSRLNKFCSTNQVPLTIRYLHDTCIQTSGVDHIHWISGRLSKIFRENVRCIRAINRWSNIDSTKFVFCNHFFNLKFYHRNNLFTKPATEHKTQVNIFSIVLYTVNLPIMHSLSYRGFKAFFSKPTVFVMFFYTSCRMIALTTDCTCLGWVQCLGWRG